MTIPRPRPLMALFLLLAVLGACRADVKNYALTFTAPEPMFDGLARQWKPYVPRADDKCLAVVVDSISGPYDKLPVKEPAACSVKLLVPDGSIPTQEGYNEVELNFEQGDRLCFLLKRSQKLILVFGPDGTLRAVEDHYPPVPTKITE